METHSSQELLSSARKNLPSFLITATNNLLSQKTIYNDFLDISFKGQSYQSNNLLPILFVVTLVLKNRNHNLQRQTALLSLSQFLQGHCDFDLKRKVNADKLPCSNSERRLIITAAISRQWRQNAGQVQRLGALKNE